MFLDASKEAESLTKKAKDIKLMPHGLHASPTQYQSKWQSIYINVSAIVGMYS